MVQNLAAVLLMGAIGGYLTPTVNRIKSERFSVNWGITILSPVAGAVMGAVGLLLVQNTVGRLGDVPDEDLSKLWDSTVSGSTTGALALAVALAFGFSAKLTSSYLVKLGKSFEEERKEKNADVVTVQDNPDGGASEADAETP